MKLGLQGKIAFVTGATRGLGLAAATALAQEGCRVAIMARDGERLGVATEELRKHGASFGVVGDVTHHVELSNAWNDVRRELGDPEIFVYNNSGPANSYFENVTDEELSASHDLTVRGFLWCMREALPAMKQRGWGRIVTLGSIAIKEPHKEYPLVLHNTFRLAQLGMSKTLANEYARYGITVNTIATGTIDHDGNSFVRAYAAGFAQGLTKEQIDRQRVATVPAGRLGRSEELGALCAFLCSELAGYITGQAIYLDGGRTQSPV